MLAVGRGQESGLQSFPERSSTPSTTADRAEETRKLNVGLDTSVQALVAGVQKTRRRDLDGAPGDFGLRGMVMLALGAATLIGSALFVWRYVGANILRRIGALQRSMQWLSDGDLDTEIHRSKQRDEIAAMGDALEIFRAA